MLASPPPPSRAARAGPSAPAAPPQRLPPPPAPRCLLSLAADALHAGQLPPVLPCRAAEQAGVEDFLRRAVSSGVAASLYVCGSPGVGKTAVVVSVCGGER